MEERVRTGGQLSVAIPMGMATLQDAVDFVVFRQVCQHLIHELRNFRSPVIRRCIRMDGLTAICRMAKRFSVPVRLYVVSRLRTELVLSACACAVRLLASCSTDT
jgi:hypothetical protein